MKTLEKSLIGISARSNGSGQDYLTSVENQLLGQYMEVSGIPSNQYETCETCNNCGSGNCASCCSSSDD